MTTEKTFYKLGELWLHEQDISNFKNFIDCADCYIRTAVDAIESLQKIKSILENGCGNKCRQCEYDEVYCQELWELRKIADIVGAKKYVHDRVCV